MHPWVLALRDDPPLVVVRRLREVHDSHQGLLVARDDSRTHLTALELLLPDSRFHYGNTHVNLLRVEARCNLEVLDDKQVNADAQPVEDCLCDEQVARLTANKPAGVQYSRQLLCLLARMALPELFEHVQAATIFETLLRKRDLHQLHGHHVQNVEATVCVGAMILPRRGQAAQYEVMESAIVAGTRRERQVVAVAVTDGNREVGSKFCEVDCVAPSIQVAIKREIGIRQLFLKPYLRGRT